MGREYCVGHPLLLLDDAQAPNRHKRKACNRTIPPRWLRGFPRQGKSVTLNWLRVFRRLQLFAALIREANRGIRVQGGQKNAWHSRTDVERN